MIYKFISNNDEETAIEFKNVDNHHLSVSVTDLESDKSNQSARNIYLELTDNDLFELIGNLLRIQSQIKKG